MSSIYSTTESDIVLKFSDMFEFQEKQKLAFSYIGKKSRILYGGARGGGKTALAVAAAVASSLQFPGLRTVVIRRTLENLRSQIILNELLKKYPQKFYTYRKSEKTAYFDNGSIIFFRSLEHPEDVQNEQGIERGLYILDEAEHLEQFVIEQLLGSLRQFDIPEWKPTLLLTANPGGICQDYLKSRWIRPDYSKWSDDELELKDEYVFIESKVYDNKYATKGYISTLKALPEDLRRAWLDGDWDVFSGQFFTEWNPDKHIIPPMDFPKEWVRWRAIDLGYGAHPSVCLFATQDPETGRLYVYDEVATYDMTDTFIQLIINKSEDYEFVDTFFDPNSLSGRLDSADQMSPAMMFERAGIFVSRANNERQNGWRNLKQWLTYRKDVEDDEPMVKICANCEGLIETLPKQRFVRNKFDLDTRGQDDYVDAFRYLTSHIMYGYIYRGSDEYEMIDQRRLHEARRSALPSLRGDSSAGQYLRPWESGLEINSIYSYY